MVSIADYIAQFPLLFKEDTELAPWTLCQQIPTRLTAHLSTLGEAYVLRDTIAIHREAVIEEGAVLKGPLIIGPGCFVAAHAYLRGGVWLMDHVKIGPGVEVKTSLIFPNTSIAHFNFIGDSLIGSDVNMEAGAVIANHYNERADKIISVKHKDILLSTGCEKFGALIGDHSRIGANAVLSPGTLLNPKSIVDRLALIKQI